MELRDFSNLQDEMATLKVIKADLVSRVATVSGNLEVGCSTTAVDFETEMVGRQTGGLIKAVTLLLASSFGGAYYRHTKYSLDPVFRGSRLQAAMTP